MNRSHQTIQSISDIYYIQLACKQAMSSSNSPKQSSSSQGSASEEYIRIVEQLIDSDDDETIMKKMIELQTTFPLLKKMIATLTNQEKINMFLRDTTFRLRLTEKLRETNRLFFEPIVKVSLYTIRHRCQIEEQFNQADLQRSLSKFGSVQTLMFDKKTAYFRFDNYVSCYAAIKILNHFEVSDTLRISMSWCEQNDLNTIEQYYAARCVSSSNNIKKKTARYDIYLEINTQFELSKKIIGPKGVNMKKILTEVLEKSKVSQLPLQSKESVAKLRLRGKGSGFLQGWNHAESEQMLNLCVSSKNSQVFTNLCEQCEKLLLKIGWDYKQYYFKLHKKQCEGIIYRKFQLKKNGYELTKQMNLQQVNNTLDFIDSAAIRKKIIKEKEIIKLISLRDKARKQGRYSEADEIRQFLSKEGVMLIDAKHASGKEMKTTWKYL